MSIRPQPHARFSAAQIVARARSRLGEDRYRLTTNNCEHFCAWCLSGESRSEQIESLLGRARAVALAIGRFACEAFGSRLVAGLGAGRS